MEFVNGTIADNGCTVRLDDDDRLTMRDRDDQPLKLEPGERVVLYGVMAAKRSKRHRRLLVHEVYVQKPLFEEAG